MKREASIIWQMGCLHRAFFENVREQLPVCSLHPKQGPIIGALLCRDRLSQADLVRELNVSAATVAVSVARLERLGMILRVRDEHNRRAYILTLTEKGRTEGEKMRDNINRVQEKVLLGFSQQELDTLEAYCQRMLHNLQGDNKSGKEGMDI